MGKVSFGFKKPSAPSSSTPTAQVKSNAAFGAADDADDDEAMPSTSKASSSQKAALPSSARPSAPASKASQQRTLKALEVDSSIYDYDGVYDSLKSTEKLKRTQKEQERAKRDPKYIEGMLDSVKERNKLLLRAQAKKTQRERDAEGQEFQDGEEFVTDAYREQLEEMKRLEEEEKEAEEKQAKKRGPSGMASFYKDMMESQEAQHQAAVQAAAASGSLHDEHPDAQEQKQDDSTSSAATQAKAKGLDAQINDEGELVDQRSVLSAGLNVLGRGNKKRPDPSLSREQSHSSPHRRPRDGAAESHRLRQEARERSSRAIEDQILQLEQQKEQDKLQEEEDRKRKFIGERRNDDSKVEEAKRRMEERKRRKLEQQQEGGS